MSIIVGLILLFVLEIIETCFLYLWKVFSECVCAECTASSIVGMLAPKDRARMFGVRLCVTRVFSVSLIILARFTPCLRARNAHLYSIQVSYTRIPRAGVDLYQLRLGRTLCPNGMAIGGQSIFISSAIAISANNMSLQLSSLLSPVTGIRFTWCACMCRYRFE